MIALACIAIGLGEPALVVFLESREVKVADGAARAEARELGNETRQIALILAQRKSLPTQNAVVLTLCPIRK